MLAKLEMKLNVKADELSYQMASTFHGVLMEMLPETYASQLHVSKRHPFAQHIERRGENWYWIVSALNEEATRQLLQDVLMQIDEFTVKRHQLTIQIIEKTYQELTDQQLARAFYHEQAGKYITIQFITPTAFKQNGRYVNYPNIRLIFSNIMNSYATCTGEAMYDEDTLEQLTDKAFLTRFELRSASFSLEGVRIPAFIGRMTLKMTGTQTMTNFARMLFEFSCFSGIGIKTALGMGAVKILEERTGGNARQTN